MPRPALPSILDLLLPRRCVLCRAAGTPLCSDCSAELPPAPDLGAPPGMTACWSLLEHRDAGRDVVVALKFHRHLDAVDLWGSAMAQLVTDPVALVTWAPTSAQRRRARGFDQAGLLARAVAAQLGVSCLGLLERTSGAGQAGRGRSDRLQSPEFVTTRRTVPIRTGPVLVVDDVRTTGATLSAAADALVLAGLAPVLGVTLSVRV